MISKRHSLGDQRSLDSLVDSIVHHHLQSVNHHLGAAQGGPSTNHRPNQLSSQSCQSQQMSSQLDRYIQLFKADVEAIVASRQSAFASLPIQIKIPATTSSQSAPSQQLNSRQSLELLVEFDITQSHVHAVIYSPNKDRVIMHMVKPLQAGGSQDATYVWAAVCILRRFQSSLRSKRFQLISNYDRLAALMHPQRIQEPLSQWTRCFQHLSFQIIHNHPFHLWQYAESTCPSIYRHLRRPVSTHHAPFRLVLVVGHCDYSAILMKRHPDQDSVLGVMAMRSFEPTLVSSRLFRRTISALTAALTHFHPIVRHQRVIISSELVVLPSILHRPPTVGSTAELMRSIDYHHLIPEYRQP